MMPLFVRECEYLRDDMTLILNPEIATLCLYESMQPTLYASVLYV